MRLEDLERELRAERPDVDPEFARKLDEWAAAGFPRGGSLDSRAERRRAPGALRRAWEKLTAVPPRRLLAPVGAAAVLIVVGAGVTQVDLGGDTGEVGGGANTRFEPFSAESEPIEDDAPVASDAVTEQGRLSEDAAESATSTIAPPSDTDAGGLARGTDERLQDKTATLRLGADADQVQEVANGVVEVTDRHQGIVLNSQVTSDQGGARASFRLEIPFTELDAALADLSELGDMISRTEAAADITQQYVRAQKQRARILERVEQLRIELIEAETRERRLVLESRIRTLNAQANAYEAEANQTERRARFATLTVEVTSGGPDSDDDGWSLGDAVDDAGDVLRTIAGVGLVSLAVIVPIALVGALGFWIAISARRKSRERALDT